ncbi:MAG: glycerol-3-phosphate dehydrogenase [Planctomycetes bacterium RBG_16_59_8]|nr:MAG: glycerol-3-phosphate dehydrogenase [Planctomycetes bacterium RBG_16_59_8]
MAKKIVVLGDGGWGTALALLLHRNGHSVDLWGNFPEYVDQMRRRKENVKFLPGVKLPPDLFLLSGDDIDLNRYDLAVVAVPTQFIRGTIGRLRKDSWRCRSFLTVAKGIEEKTGRTPSAILRELTGSSRIAVLSGPSHAEEVARSLPASVVVASRHEFLAQKIQTLFSCGAFRVYTSHDPLGLELGGALKNVIAIAAGICDGLALGDNAKAALLARGVVEMARIGTALGAKKKTFFGLSGIGDLVTTCYSPHGRNLRVGREIGRGKSLEAILGGMEMVAEGVWTTRSIARLAREKGIDAPITGEVYNVLFKGKPPMKAVLHLMTRLPRNED